MTDYKFRALIGIKVGKRSAANNFWKASIDPDGGESTFTNGLSPSGQPPATWYWCNTVLTQAQLFKVVQVADANPTDVKIVVWVRPNYDGVKQHLINAAANRSYITIANEAKSPSQFLVESGLQKVAA